MTYLKSYGIAVFEISKILGFIFLISAFFYGMGAAVPFIYLSLVAGLAGPLSLMVGGKQKC